MKLFQWMDDEARACQCAAMTNDDAAASANALLRGNGCIAQTPHLIQTWCPSRVQQGAKWVALMLFASVISLATQPAHAMKTVGKSAGPTTPYLPDFSPGYASKAGHIGYGNSAPHQTLLETLPIRCAPHEHGVSSANFSITLQKLSVTPADARHTRLIFWDRGAQHFNTQIWMPHEPVGSVKTLNFNIGALPQNGGMVHMNDGYGLNLLRDRDFSFSVNDDAGVMQAKLTYQCAGHALAQGHNGVTNAYAPLMLDAPPTMQHQPQLDRFGRITYSTNFSTPADTPCPHLNSAYGRAMIGSQLIMRRIAPNADIVCARRGAPNGFSQIVFTSCAMDARGPSHGLITRATVTCNS